MKFLTLLFFAALSFTLSINPKPAHALAEGTGLKFLGAVDLTGNFFAKDQAKYPRRFEPREVEFGVYGPIDHGFDGALFFAAHNEGGQYNLELHEAFLASSKLIPNTRLKAGKFFLGIGRLNQFHRHDWPFISAPLAHQRFFDEEAAADSGVQTNTLLPFMPVFTEVGLGVTSGWTWGHSHSQGVRPNQPTHYARITNFFAAGETGGLQSGLNYVGRNAANDGEMRLFGLDLTGKWRQAGVLQWLLQWELWGRNLRPRGGALERAYGGYFYGQRHISGPWDIGIRLDGHTIDTSPTRNLDYTVLSNLVYRHSEFLNFKGSYQWDFEKRGHRDSLANRVLQVQAVFLLGDHPAHDF